MLQEIFLSLSGHPSPIWEQVAAKSSPQDVGLHAYLSEPEQAMLQKLAYLSKLHIQIKNSAGRISKKSNSPICRAVSSSIADVHLGGFRRKILEVESSILRKDATFVGGYEIVPLSTIVGAFLPWIRRLEWLNTIVIHIDHTEPVDTDQTSMTGPALLGLLLKHTRTGYSDIEDMASQLLIHGQKVWMRIAASWILDGVLPTIGLGDFFVQRNATRKAGESEYSLNSTLVPDFVSQLSAETIYAIGDAFNQIRRQNISGTGNALRGDSISALLPAHLKLIQSLNYPLNPTVFESMITTINDSVSQNALSHLLPFHQVSELLKVVQEYVLLGRGEFAVSLITNADDRVNTHQSSHSLSRPVRKIGRLDDMAVKEAELNSILNKAWVELESLQEYNNSEDELLTYARQLLRLTSFQGGQHDSLTQVSTLLPSPATLELALPADSSLNLFLAPPDIKIYACINAYLLSIRRAELHLGAPWKMTSHRRCHPTPVGPPETATVVGQQAARSRRNRESSRSKTMRKHWSSTSKALFVMNELAVYLYGEVIQNSWDHFDRWLRSGISRPSSAKSQSSRPGTSSSKKDQIQSMASNPNALQSSINQQKQSTRTDPRKLAKAHQTFLHTLYTSLLLEKQDYLHVLKRLLNLIDHYVALFSRLQIVWQGLDLQEDDGVVDAFSNYAQDEQDILAEMDRSRTSLEACLAELTEKIRIIEQEQAQSSMLQLKLEQRDFIPWKSRTIDRLIMKFDFMIHRKEETDDGGINEIDD